MGEILLRSDLTADKFPTITIDNAVAATQGQIGIMLQHALAKALARPSSTVCTTVVVSESDPDFQNPTKYVGRFYDADEAKVQAADLGWKMKEDPGRGWRRVVPSPKPSGIIEVESVRALVASGTVVVACGGGGVPATKSGDVLTPVEAVVDKDLSSALLARELGATRFIILTAVDEVMVDFGKPTEKKLRDVGVDELRKHAKDGQFLLAVWGPKLMRSSNSSTAIRARGAHHLARGLWRRARGEMWHVDSVVRRRVCVQEPRRWCGYVMCCD